ncbi:MAG TPA: von Willebrand factor type A domain-containing protein [Steroidobacteraceae bacterium]|nr:von Willebrand factor type A domain-containing protein [Steroidobacteraceae bacterium]
MNAHSFERRLRDLESPATDPQAKLLAQRAALAEFDRIHAAQDAANSATTPARWRLFAWPPRGMAWGGVATACLALVAVSLLWLTPPEERAVHAPEVAVVEQRAEAMPPGPQAPVQDMPQPGPPPQLKMELPEMKLPPVRQSAPPVTPPDLQRAVEARREAEVASTAVTTVTDRPAPPAPPPPALGAVSKASDSVQEVQVTRSRITQQTFASNSPLVTIAPREPVAAAVGPGRFNHFETNPVHRVADAPVSTFSADVDTASYSVMRRQINEGGLPPADAVRVEEMINYFDYAWPAATSRNEPFRPTVVVSDSPWAEGRKLIHIGIRGYELPVSQQPDANLVLLLDVSGSMNSPDKLPLAQQALALLLDSLKPTDTVAIVVYAGAAGQVLAPTPVSDRETILRALYSLRPGGSTAGAAGIRLAYELAGRNFRKEGVNRILLATDGDFNVGITDMEQLKSFVARERDRGVFLSVLGFGEGNYRDDMAQMLAQNGNGVAAYIDSVAEARKVLVQQATASLFTIAKDVKLQVEFNPATVAEYRLIGYETRALNEEDFRNDKVDAGDIGSGHTVTAIYEITPAGSKSMSLDERRYAGEQPAAAARRGQTSEYGYLKIRYKLPDGRRSRLIEQPIRRDATVSAALRQDVAFSTAVAGFGQLLRDNRYTGDWGFGDVIELAQPAIGTDPHGYRAEFVQLVRRAQAMEPAQRQR